MGGGLLQCLKDADTNEDDIMETENNNRKRRIYVRLTDKEFTNLENRFKTSTCQNLSDYVRRCLFNRPITTITRDAATDDLILQMSQLNYELNAVGNNFNQLVKKVNSTPQFTDAKSLFLLVENQKKALVSKIDEVKEQIQKMAEKWLR
ncbi:plasmid mobilization protein [Flavobacterium rivuli]|nr:plasmid mobilization relaxosome protein MobC [Flavobacterium rivuli]